ncbi:MAG: lipopolysaccharide heptosyltransferase II [Candidatus Omnitrophota bacterium]|nr:lipopolysaccharide heptosyltransferase II [Candidatus Omnitrophota bacterium]
MPALKGGGVETGTIDMARGLIARGHRAVVISSGGPMVAELEELGAIHYTLPIHRKNPWVFLPLVGRIAEVVESHGVDVIHSRSRVPAIVGYLAWRRVARKISFRLGGRQRIPCFITTAHGYYADHPISRIMGWGRLVIANSESIARHMMDDFGVPSEKIRFIPRGVDLDRYAWKAPRLEAPRGEWQVGAIGRITPIKGLAVLIRAFAVIAKQLPRAKLLIIGAAEPKHQGHLAELKSWVSRLGLEERVEFSGHRADVPAMLQQLDLLVLPSIGKEAFGRVLIEAGAAGVPVVATRVGGIPEVVLDRKTGLLVPPADPMELSRAVLELLKDRKLALEFSRENRRRVETVYPMTRMVSQTLEAYQEASERLRILVIKLSATGDVVLITPSLRALRKRFPQAHITILVGREHSELLNRCPYIDDLISFDRRREGTPLGLLKVSKRLRSAQVDLVVDFQNNRISHWLGALSGAPHRYGFAGRKWSWLLSHAATEPARPVPPVDHQFRLLQLLGLQEPSKDLELWPGPGDEARVEKLLKEAWIAENQPLVTVHPGSRWASKRWPAERYVELIDRLAVLSKARVILTGSDKERPLCEQIQRAAKSKPFVAAGMTSLNEMAALMRRSRVFVGGDTAPLHIAAAAGIPVVALFGSTAPLRHAPPAARKKILKTELPCSPCYRSSCPRVGAGHMECMKRITTDDVARAVAEFL